MFDDIFAPIDRDGAGLIEIHFRFQKAFGALVAADRVTLGDAGRQHSASALKRAQVALTLEDDRRAIRTAAEIMNEDHSHRLAAPCQMEALSSTNQALSSQLITGRRIVGRQSTEASA